MGRIFPFDLYRSWVGKELSSEVGGRGTKKQICDARAYSPRGGASQRSSQGRWSSSAGSLRAPIAMQTHTHSLGLI